MGGCWGSTHIVDLSLRWYFSAFSTRWLCLPGLVQPRIFLLAWTLYSPTTMSLILGQWCLRIRAWHMTDVGFFTAFLSSADKSDFCRLPSALAQRDQAQRRERFLLRLPPPWGDASSRPKLLPHLTVWLFEFLPVWYTVSNSEQRSADRCLWVMIPSLTCFTTRTACDVHYGATASTSS